MKFDFKKYVEETNAEFEASSPAQKRVLIAGDVIKRIEFKNLVAEAGNVVAVDDVSIASNTSLKEIVNEELAQCKVCGKGALLCAFVGRVNKFSLRDASKWETSIKSEGDENKDLVHNKLQELFTREQLDLIECAFEATTYLDVAPEHLQDRAFEFYYNYHSQNERLIAIMENIIKHKGEFIP